MLAKRVSGWQDTEFVLVFFAKRLATAQKRYRAFVQKGIDQGPRPELVGGGLVRSAGGWSALKSRRQSGFRQKSDERILGDGDFVNEVLAHANESLDLS